ncbi:hypothetical protein [Pseudoalteromonas luteoviolacea]|uniref:hypothetical protein n=1 Tax=Pseudoalteromonas luteoviolacea TaxID=43657 RepID=UPI00114F1E54|nr:hypothetical protein [Pseudoalteromonas luteoviolacea]TQF70058.1 hypothetical protein FLM44_02900 [Pseudoalteromonas luteoviolacea]
MKINLILIALIYFSAGVAVSSIFIATTEPVRQHHECVGSLVDSYVETLPVSNIQTVVDNDLNSAASPSYRTHDRHGFDDNVYELILHSEDINGAIEHIQSKQIAQKVQVEQAILNRILQIQIGDIEAISEALAVMLELDLAISEPQVVSHLLETVLLADPNQQSEITQVLSVLNGSVTTESIPSLLSIVESHSEFNPLVAWQAMALLAQTSHSDNVKPYFDKLSRSSYTAIVVEGAQAWLDSNGTMNFNDAKYLERFIAPKS